MRTGTLKSLAALALTGVGSALIVGFKVHETPLSGAAGTPVSVAAPATRAAGPVSPGSGVPGPRATTSAGPAATAQATSGTAVAYADGTWTGPAVDEPWGPFQVEAVVSGGRLTDVVLVTSPTDRHSSRINRQAVPALTQEAIAAQGASVDLVSGATWTSESYATSLQAALDQARAAMTSS